MSGIRLHCDNGPVSDLTPAPAPPPGRFRPGTLSSNSRVVAGVATRIAAALGASVLVVRVAFAVLGLAAGWGVVAYGVAWVWLRGRPDSPARHVTLRRNLGVVAATAAQLVFVDDRIGGVQPGLLWPVALIAFAVVLAEPGSGAGANVGSDRRGGHVGRVIAGAVLMLAGFFAALAGTQDAAALVRIVPAALVLVGGLALVLTPWLRSLLVEADAERVRRAQAEARADMAAHLHDSVLQTLTLIQNRAGEPEIAAALAHRQERELRRWLYAAGVDDPADATTLRAALEATAAEIEDQYLKIVECVVVGDTPMTDEVHAVVSAAREAIVNAAKFAEIPMVSVYAEVVSGDDDCPFVAVYVRDRGVGFDPEAVSADRHGIADSIHGRLSRVGGAALVQSTVGAGTEVRLRWPT